MVSSSWPPHEFFSSLPYNPRVSASHVPPLPGLITGLTSLYSTAPTALRSSRPHHQPRHYLLPPPKKRQENVLRVNGISCKKERREQQYRGLETINEVGTQSVDSCPATWNYSSAKQALWFPDRSQSSVTHFWFSSSHDHTNGFNHCKVTYSEMKTNVLQVTAPFQEKKNPPTTNPKHTNTKHRIWPLLEDDLVAKQQQHEEGHF